jgi:hypothetical protein
MEMSDYVSGLRRELSSLTRFAGEDVARIVELLGEALESALRLTLLEVLTAAAAEITAELDGTLVEVRLADGEPSFVVTHDMPVPPGPPPAGPSAPDAGDEAGTARVTLRLPEGLKARIEAAAAGGGVSVNTWLVRAASQALGNPAGPGGPGGFLTRTMRGPGRRIQGFARS